MGQTLRPEADAVGILHNAEGKNMPAYFSGRKAAGSEEQTADA